MHRLLILIKRTHKHARSSPRHGDGIPSQLHLPFDRPSASSGLAGWLAAHTIEKPVPSLRRIEPIYYRIDIILTGGGGSPTSRLKTD